ncbi:MAG: CsgG/HfaB family protein [Halothiobacillaceae bacterium]|nr:CsgG/HfaB family protein [Halothiobacillaceae bacterium]
MTSLKKLALTSTALSLIGLLSGCASTMEVGNESAKTVATGSAGGATSQGESTQLEKCPKPMGTIAVEEDTSAAWSGILTGQMHLGSTAPVLNLMIQQSNCFVVVNRGRGMNQVMGERALRDTGEMRATSNFGKGQIVSADYALIPSVTFSNNNAGGAGMALGGLLGPIGAVIGGSLNYKEASTLLTLVDNRSSVQLAAAEGSAQNTDFGAIGGLFGGAGGGLGGGYSNTAEGKVIVAAFMDSYNNIVRAVRQYKAQEVEGGLGTGGQLGVQPEQQTPVTAPTSKKKKK